MAVPTSTYRLQISPSADLHAAADLCDYLATLGVGAVYLSPLLPSAKGSDHGYDVVGFDRVDPARGGADGWTRLLAAARARGLGIVVDIVPNHTGVADAGREPGVVGRAQVRARFAIRLVVRHRVGTAARCCCRCSATASTRPN